MNPERPEPADPALQRFLQALAAAQAQGRWLRLVLSGPRPGHEAGPQRVTVRPLLLRGQPVLSFHERHATRDETHHQPVAEALARIAAELGPRWRHATFEAPGETLALRFGKRGTGHLSRSAAPAGPAEPVQALAPAAHDRAKQRWVPPEAPFLQALGITGADGRLVPAMARKWKQINRFVEIVSHALDEAGLLAEGGPRPLRVLDFGAGRAYLTFAVHDWLVRHGLPCDVRGVELREELVHEGNASIARLGLQGLQMVQGDVSLGEPVPADVMIALHACDTATDHAIHRGIAGGARVIVCSPCCHKQLRAQLLSPHPLRSIFQHGIHAEQQAEMLTDTLRALLLQAAGYETQVFEFVALEHTRKNKMILAIQRRRPAAVQARLREAALAEVAGLKQFFGVREQQLERLLSAPG